MTDPGKRRYKVDLVRDHVTREKGAEVRTPETYATVRAGVKYLSGNELYKAQQLNAQVNVRVNIRYRADVLAAHRVIFKGNSLEIKAVRPDEKFRELNLECKE